MTGFIVCMSPPSGPTEYMPEGYGFTAHAHTLDRAKAAIWPDEATAWRAANGYRWPVAFWECERRHRDQMARKFRGWTFTVEKESRP